VTGGSIALNWIPFEQHSGASGRAFELHRRLQGEFDLTAFVTGAFPSDYRRELTSVRFVEVAPRRTQLGRILEGSALWWRGRVEPGCRLWVTDTLPVVRLRRTASVFTVHDLRHTADRSFSSRRRRLLMGLTMSRSLRRADAVVSVSRWGAKTIAEYAGLPECRITVIPNAPGSLALPVPVPCDGDSHPFILAVGHLERRKNLECLLRAFSRVASIWPGSLVLAGSDQGIGAALAGEATRLGLADRVRILGSVTSGRLADLYASCDLLVCPSLYEGFGMTLLEGMAAGRPVVASAIPPHIEVAGNAALLVATGEGMAERLAEDLLAVLEDAALRENLAARGIERAAAFSWDRSAAMLRTLYLELMDTREDSRE
jgi:glycosyltransferase involved in cell wall biosynthesis